MPVNISYSRGKTPKELLFRQSMLNLYTSQNNITITKTFEDVTRSGFDFNRIGLQRMMQYVVNNKVDALYVRDIVQIGRDLPRVIELIKDINDYSTKIFILGETGCQEVNVKLSNAFYYLQDGES